MNNLKHIDINNEAELSRFWAKVNKTNSGCWEYQAYQCDGRYCRIRVGGIRTGAHRYSYLIHKGDPGELLVCHKCDNTRCVNPDHLFLGTNQDNASDMVKKKRQAIGIRNGKYTKPLSVLRGVKHGRCKLSETQIKAIRALKESGFSDKRVASIFSVKKGNIWNIVNKTWKHI